MTTDKPESVTLTLTVMQAAVLRYVMDAEGVGRGVDAPALARRLKQRRVRLAACSAYRALNDALSEAGPVPEETFAACSLPGYEEVERVVVFESERAILGVGDTLADAVRSANNFLPLGSPLRSERLLHGGPGRPLPAGTIAFTKLTLTTNEWVDFIGYADSDSVLLGYIDGKRHCVRAENERNGTWTQPKR